MLANYVTETDHVDNKALKDLFQFFEALVLLCQLWGVLYYFRDGPRLLRNADIVMNV